MKGMHPLQLAALELIPSQESVLLLTRHSIREEADNSMPGFDIPLTPEGISLAEAWGERLGSALSPLVYSSQSPRCIDTGAAMLRGAGSHAEVELVDLLREPGCYVEEIRRAGPVFKHAGPLGFVNQLLAGTVPGAYPPGVATQKVLDWLASNAAGPGRITVCVTHDTILGTFVNYLNGVAELDDTDWPWMMEGVFLWQTGEHWHWVWRGLEHQMSRHDLTDLRRSSPE